MSATSTTRRQMGQGGMGGGPMARGGPMGAMGRPVEKAKDFSGTLKRLLLYFVPEKANLSIVFIAAIFGLSGKSTEATMGAPVLASVTVPTI